MKKTCPRCGSPFECRADDVARCDCAGVALNDRARARLEAQFDGCLCIRCLRTLKPDSLLERDAEQSA